MSGYGLIQELVILFVTMWLAWSIVGWVCRRIDG